MAAKRLLRFEVQSTSLDDFHKTGSSSVSSLSSVLCCCEVEEEDEEKNTVDEEVTNGTALKELVRDRLCC